MENKFGVIKRDHDDPIELPPGFRFHPTDEELITHYLSNKVLDSSFSAAAIGEVDMNKAEPWELPWSAKFGEKEWYFFCIRDRKYPSGQRTNRATSSGYWKATGKDKEIYREKTLVGMRKTLVFYKGRAPKGEKSNWVTHEFRLEGEFSLEKSKKSSKNEWVIARVFHKTSSGQKVHISGLMRMDWEGNKLNISSTMPTLVESLKPEWEPGHVHCFSRPVSAPQKIQEDLITYYNDPIFLSASKPVDSFPTVSLSPGMIPFQDPTILRTLTGNYGQNLNQVRKDKETENSCDVSNLETGKKSFEDGPLPITSIGSMDFDCIWSC